MLDPTAPRSALPARRLSGEYSFADGYRGLELTPDGDAFRILEKYHRRLLLAETPDDYPEIYLLGANGLWMNDPASFLSIQQRMITDYASEIAFWGSQDEITGLPPGKVGRAVQDCISRKSIGKAEEARKSIGSLLIQIADLYENEMPSWVKDLNRCRLEEIDADMSCIATPDGVLDLKTGKVLPPHEGSLRRMTSRYALLDSFKQDATHPNVERLFNHMPPKHAAYIGGELGYCLWGAPTRRVLFLVGEGGGGKTTLANAIRASFGPLVSRPGAKSVSKDPHGSIAENDTRAQYFVAPYRFALIEEAGDVQVNEEAVKERSGDVDGITYSLKYQNPVNRRPTATMTFISNDTPKQIGLKDEALRDRVRVLPYHPVPTEQQIGTLKLAWFEQNDDARKMRQAFVAYLVRFCQVHPLGSPPEPPPEMLEQVEVWANAELGEFGQWVKANLIPDARSFAVIEDVWKAAKEQFTPDRNDAIHGVRRAGFAAYARAVVPALPKATRPRSQGQKYGWLGWRLLTDDDLPFVEESEFELDISNGVL